MSCVLDEHARRQMAQTRRQHLQRRLVEYLVTISCILLLNFWLPRLLPGDPFALLSGSGTGSDLAISLDAASEAALRAYYGLDRPLWAQFGLYLNNLVHGDLGYAYYFKAPVSRLLADRLPWSLLIMLPGILLATLLGIAAGVWTAWHHGTRCDHSLVALAVALRAIPAFFLGTLLLLLFSVKLAWFPLFGAYDIDSAAAGWGKLGDILWHAALPILTLALIELPGKLLLTRSAMLTTLGEDYIAYARARGLSKYRLMFAHALPNALLPVTTHIGLRLGMAVGGTIYVETIFGYPGMGKFMYEAVAARDFPVLQGGFLVISLTVLVLNLLVDVLYAYLDPRVEV